MHDQSAENRYEITADGVPAGHSYYRVTPASLVVTHTEVDGAYEGKGVGSALMKGMLDDIRSRGLGVVPLCPFTKAYVERHPEYQDLLHHHA